EYDLAAFDTEALRDEIERGPHSLWRYAPLLPVAAPRGDFAVGWTPLIRAPRLGAAIGVAQLFVKDDSRNPSLSFKDRPVAVALARALELGLDTIACASTGNVEGAVASAADRYGLHDFDLLQASTGHGKYSCAPGSDAGLGGYRPVRPVRDPVTVARSLAIGAPADGDGSVEIIRASGGSAGSVSDEEVLEGCALLASTEGVLAEPAGGVVVATAKALARRGR